MAIHPSDLQHVATYTSYWDDMIGSASAINPPGQVSDPDYDAVKGGWLFAASGTESLIVIDQINHQWVPGTEVRPHIHWEKTTSAAGAVLWRIDVTISAHLTAREALAALDAVVVENSDVADTQMISKFPAIDMTDKGGVSTILIAHLSRIGGDAADTYGADARFLSFDYHIQKNSPGSVEEYSKPGPAL